MDAKHSEDGGPAFPVFDEFHGEVQGGMSLRDYFAAQALAGFTSISIDEGEPVMGAFDTARACYNYADAMLRARES